MDLWVTLKQPIVQSLTDQPYLVRTYVYMCMLYHLDTLQNIFVKFSQYVCPKPKIYLSKFCDVDKSNLQIFCTFEFASCVLELGHIPVSTQILVCKYMMDFVQTIVVCKC